jgi:hypothetical protein
MGMNLACCDGCICDAADFGRVNGGNIPGKNAYPSQELMVGDDQATKPAHQVVNATELVSPSAIAGPDL